MKSFADLNSRTILYLEQQLGNAGKGLLFETGAGKALFVGTVREIVVGISPITRVVRVGFFVKAALSREYEEIVSQTLHISVRGNDRERIGSQAKWQD